MAPTHGIGRGFVAKLYPRASGNRLPGQTSPGTYPRDLQMVYRHDVKAQSPALSVLMGQWYSPPDGWAHGLRILYDDFSS